jgi:outer membrane lipoprotein SlyB
MIMRTLSLLVILFAASQLTGCVVRSDAYGRSNYPSSDSRYRTQYPANYPTSYSNTSDHYYSQNSYYSSDQYNSNQYNQHDYTDYAQILSVRPITSTRSNNNGGGALIGAIIGGVIGNQIGRGDDSSRHSNHIRRDHDRSPYRHGSHHQSNHDGSRAAATVGGAIIGGLIGNEISRSDDATSNRTEVTLRLRSGEVKTIMVASPVHLRAGDQVRVQYQNGRMTILP